MAITNEGRAESLRLLKGALSEFRISNTGSPSVESATDGGGSRDGMTPDGGATILTFPLAAGDSTIDFTTETITVNCRLDTSQGNGQTWTEVGLYFASGDLLTREVVVNPVPKDSSNEMNFKIDVIF